MKKKNGNLLIVASILCIICLVEIDFLAQDNTWTVWPLAGVWGVLFLFGLLKVLWEKCKKHLLPRKDWRKTKRGKCLLLICIIAIVTSSVIQVIHIRNTKDTAKDLRSNQAVMAMTCSVSGCTGWWIDLYVVNREGRWKKIAMHRDLFEKMAGGTWEDVELTAELLDDIIRSPHISFEKGKVSFTEDELNRAIRRQDVSCFYRAGGSFSIGTYSEDYRYYTIQGTRDRELQKLGGNGQRNSNVKQRRDKEVYAFYAIYEKWIDAIQESKKEKTQNPEDIIRAVLIMAGLFIFLGSCEGCLLRGWWQQPSLKRNVGNTVFAVMLFLVNIVGQVWYLYKKSVMNLHIQFVLCFAFTMGIWSFWELISWRKHCGKYKEDSVNKGLYYKGNAFLITMGCCWCFILLDYFAKRYNSLI